LAVAVSDDLSVLTAGQVEIAHECIARIANVSTVPVA
jgi:hypothetical protein